LIIVLREGQVAEQGTHEELLRKGGLYYAMWQQQALADLTGTIDTDANTVEQQQQTPVQT
jgi:hypothetical protein